ncbi:hypothetical protein BD324DRAFT_650978 [Kockovaella imperatae]|uniref:Uncharacterized protein n=1 Tax=Kockovaella imperatae TaxID=4999 RepID=A0A1Y1UH48_9TREE|nr:hypothetical protein BD324DRAFT_650978 [Kockovaella imperatae]ORX37381.1 hypothetical protein BD324DRAFT_650978 [Kockovaella imperatae]
MVDLSDKSRWLRKDILAVSGGWLGELVPIISVFLSFWDIFVLAFLFIPCWIILRVSDSLTSMILGFTSDVTIPLQNQLNPKREPTHTKHLAAYWPVLIFGTGIELLCFFVVHPDLFTLVVCIKSTLMTALWLARRADGSFVVNSIGTRDIGASNASGLGSKTASSGRELPTSKIPGAESGEKKDKETPEQRWDRKLKAAGYDDEEGRKAMIEYLKGIKDPKKQEKQLREWLKEKDPEKRKKIMDRAKRKMAEKAQGTSASKLPGGEAAIGPDDEVFSLAHRPNPATFGKPGPVHPADHTGNLMPDYAPDEGPQLKYDADTGGPITDFGDKIPNSASTGDQTPPAKPAKRGLRERLGLKKSTASAPIVPGISDDDDSEENGSNDPGAHWKGMTRRHPPESAPAPGTSGVKSMTNYGQRQWARSLNLSLPRYKYSGDSSDAAPPAVWEQALPQDSLELLDYYLQDARVDYTARGQLLMDLFDQMDPKSARDLHKAWKETYNSKDWKRILAPYVGVLWRPLNQAWEAKAGGDLDEVLMGKLDQINWVLRAKGFRSAIRRAIIRDLMSQPNDQAHDMLYEALMARLRQLAPCNEMDEENEVQKATRTALNTTYWNKTDFGGQFCMSERVFEDVVRSLPPGPRSTEVIRFLRRQGTKQALELALQEYDLDRGRRAGFNA